MDMLWKTKIIQVSSTPNCLPHFPETVLKFQGNHPYHHQFQSAEKVTPYNQKPLQLTRRTELPRPASVLFYISHIWTFSLEEGTAELTSHHNASYGDLAFAGWENSWGAKSKFMQEFPPMGTLQTMRKQIWWVSFKTAAKPIRNRQNKENALKKPIHKYFTPADLLLVTHLLQQSQMEMKNYGHTLPYVT